MSFYSDALKEQLEAELNEFGEVASIRDVDIKVLKGSSRQHQQMKQAGYYDETSFEAVTLPMSFYDSAEDAYEVKDILEYDGAEYLVKSIDILEQEHGCKLIVEVMK